VVEKPPTPGKSFYNSLDKVGTTDVLISEMNVI